MEACYTKIESKTCVLRKCEKRIWSWPASVKLGSGDPTVEQKSTEIDLKMKSTWEGILASIFHEFWSILEAKMAPSWGQKSTKNRSKKASKKRCKKDRHQDGQQDAP